MTVKTISLAEFQAMQDAGTSAAAQSTTTVQDQQKKPCGCHGKWTQVSSNTAVRDIESIIKMQKLNRALCVIAMVLVIIFLFKHTFNG